MRRVHVTYSMCVQGRRSSKRGAGAGQEERGQGVIGGWCHTIHTIGMQGRQSVCAPEEGH